MAWFHKTLGDMRVAIEQEKWKKVKRIADQHSRMLYGKEMERNLRRAAVLLDTYLEKMRNIDIIITSPKEEKKARTPVGNDITILKVMAQEAQGAIAQFEEIIQKLIKEGKFME